ncbi:phosphate ABC transporter ATP-binding protein [Natronorubrum texcoconense]|uniref:Phosphate transport system ATP-binding protein n=1 Tax=Natronorubrum texcoconense TaxID=1095776 RepID=A0A1G8T636_9EURY|nr:phosphate ABC transporter ATP-binding protein [Natronorubrum texcoconense]SDJ37079.1 phosphate transport system ATP-binding protein [Natronorubrum texcoconense]
MTHDTVIRTDDLEVTYTGKREVTALNGVSVDFSENKLTAIIGPSGCGKSTLLKSLNRLHEIQPNAEITGEVYLEDDPVYETDEPLPEIRRRVGYVPQKPTPLPVSIYNNVAYGPKIHGDYSREELDDIVETQLRKVNLWSEVEDRLDSPGAELSTGQIQRLCLARSLAAEPDVLLCDEVTSALDPISAEQVEETLADLKEEYTIVMVTHSMEQAKRLADDVIFLYLGDVIETNDARTFFENPQNERTQEFVEGHAAVEYDDGDDTAPDSTADAPPAE